MRDDSLPDDDPDLLALEREVKAKIASEQDGVPTFFDIMMLNTLRFVRDASVPKAARAEKVVALKRFFDSRKQPRMQAYLRRVSDSERWKPLPWEVGAAQLKASQGVEQCISWRGIPLFKTAFECAIYPILLWELRPGTVLEIGSGSGGSAIWIADLCSALDVPVRVLSLDIKRPSVEHDSVTFLEGDCTSIEAALPLSLLAGLKHPWLLIEDAHVNVVGVLTYLRALLQTGDYLVVEDSAIKSAALAAFMTEFGAEFAVDRRYTDFFGRNATSSQDSVFARI